VREEYECGNLYINRGITGALVGRHPFGGYKMSGLGSKKLAVEIIFCIISTPELYREPCPVAALLPAE